MKTIQRLLINLCTNDLATSTKFYTSLFDFKVEFESDWFVQLVSKKNQLELGLIINDHELVPNEYRGNSNGMYLTFVVEDTNVIYEQALSLGYEVVQSPELTFYGQKRALIKDPSGVLVDVSSVESG